LLLTICDCIVLYIFASKLKAFALRDCLSGPLLRAILASGGLLAVVLAVASMHLRLLLALPLVVLCFLGYAVMFWIFAVDEEDRTTIYGLRARVFAMLRARRSATAMQISGNDAAL